MFERHPRGGISDLAVNGDGQSQTQACIGGSNQGMLHEWLNGTVFRCRLSPKDQAWIRILAAWPRGESAFSCIQANGAMRSGDLAMVWNLEHSGFEISFGS